ncbi:MAG: glycosyltransferase family 39 protein [Chloroflexota bacterium]
MTEKRLLWTIIIIFAGLGVFYALTTPVFEASDELWHYPMIEHLADGNSLPVQVFDPAQAGPWKQEASQPPLYYYLGAALTFWIDTPDMATVRWLNPHVDSGQITEDGNINLVVHDPRASRWQGTQLAVTIVRLASVLLGAATVYLTYRIARASLPGRPELALGAAAINAFMPMFLFISGAVNNDNLVIPLASLSLLLMIQIVREPGQGRWDQVGRPLLLGLVIGLGALTKISALGLLLLAAFSLFMGHWSRAGRPVSLTGVGTVLGRAILSFLLVAGPVLLVAGWWYARNMRLYGDWRGWNAFIAVLGQRAHPASLAQLWDERWGFMSSYWGLFGGLNVPMPEWIYQVLNVIVLVAVIGFAVYAIKLIRGWLSQSGVSLRGFGGLVANGLGLVERHIGLILCLLWAAAIVVGLIQWATVTWSSQGRLVFTAISALCTLMATGLAGWLPQRAAKGFLTALVLFMLVVAAAAPLLWIRPAYAVEEAQVTGDLQRIELDFGDSLRLVGFHMTPEVLRPGDSVEVTLRWQALREMDRDWSVFVHLNDPAVNIPVAQRDMFPGQGLVATRLMEPGDTLTDKYVLRIPESALAPADLTLTVGLYDYYTGERLKASGGLDAAELAQVSLLPREGAAPNPLSVNFEDRLELMGFTMPQRRFLPGETVTLTLFWQATRELDVDYSLFVQIVGEDTTRWASQDQLLTTSIWPPGQRQQAPVTMQLDEATPAGVYPVIVGLYTRGEDGEFVRLQTVTDEGRLTDDFFVLTQVRVE